MSKNNTDKNEVGRTEPSNNQSKDVLTFLKNLADNMGVEYHTNIGIEKLQNRIDEHIRKQKENDALIAKRQAEQKAVEKVKKELSPEDAKRHERMRIVKDATRLVRVSVTNMNPNKKEWEGEVFTASNSLVPTQKKYVPYNAKPWFVPRIILNVMKERKCQVFKTVQRGKHKIREGYLIPELSITELPPLTEDEFNDLKKEQAMANRIG